MSNPGSGAGDIFDVKKVRRLIELMKEHDLAEIDLRQGDQRVRLRRGAEPIVGMMAPPYLGALPAAASSSSSAPSMAPTAAADSADMAVIKSPMVGTFYSASGPESPPFVKVGAHVGPETIVCIIEAMKVFNEIPAEISGQVAAVLVENGAPVEFGQPLFKIDTRK
ncbi:MAG TPA: acetyl-CoA carboxylase biotin carboxyl carrier protein [Pirellulales bacterium]|nr:acetyl-CoA carboxylase biotin carboxyl carrier protein [Pirellulales bacterium]